jgi:hypothetical protein
MSGMVSHSSRQGNSSPLFGFFPLRFLGSLIYINRPDCAPPGSLEDPLLDAPNPAFQARITTTYDMEAETPHVKLLTTLGYIV